MLGMEFHVIGALDVHSGVGCNDLCVVAARDIGQSLHDALHVNDEALECSSDYGQLLLQEIPGDGNPMATTAAR